MTDLQDLAAYLAHADDGEGVALACESTGRRLVSASLAGGAPGHKLHPCETARAALAEGGPAAVRRGGEAWHRLDRRALEARASEGSRLARRRLDEITYAASAPLFGGFNAEKD